MTRAKLIWEPNSGTVEELLGTLVHEQEYQNHPRKLMFRNNGETLRLNVDTREVISSGHRSRQLGTFHTIRLLGEVGEQGGEQSEEQDPAHYLESLLREGLTPTEAIDVWAVDHAGYSRREWGAIRGSSSSVDSCLSTGRTKTEASK